MAYEYDNLGNPILVPDNSQGVSVVPTGAPTDTNIVRKPVQSATPPNIFQQTSAMVNEHINGPRVVTPLEKYVTGQKLTGDDYRTIYEMENLDKENKLRKEAGMDTISQMDLLKPYGVQSIAQTPAVTQEKPQITSMEELAKAMGYTSPEEEAKLQKASITNRRILAVADALRHIGNIAHTVKYAPSQQFNSPVLEEEKRYEKGKALRDAANARYFSYKQARERQDAAQRQWETQFKYNMAKDAANFELKKNESEAKQQRQKALAELDKARLEGQIDKNTYQRLVNKFYPETAQAKITEIESRVAKNNRTNVGGSNGGGRRKVNAGSGGGKYWVDVPGRGRIYYPNKTMWQQGVEQFSKGLEQTKEIPNGTDAFGRQKTKNVQRSAYDKGGELNRRYEESQKKNQKASSGKGKTNANKGKTGNNNKGKGTWGSFSIHK